MGGTDRDRAAAAVGRLVEEHGGALYAIARRLCGDPDEAEDLVQEVFLRAHASWSGFRGESSERAWLYRIAANACRRMHRPRAGEPDRIGSLDELLPWGEPRIAVIASEQEEAAQIRIRAESRERLEAEIARLPDAFRMPLVLKEIAGLSASEIGGILGVGEGTVRSRVHRARLKLRAAVDRALPRREGEAPPPAYDERTCLDLLDAKQAALDRGEALESEVVCERCRSVFASLDLTQRVCRELAAGGVPAGLLERLRERLGGGPGGVPG